MLGYIQITQLICFALLMSLGQILFKKTALSISSKFEGNQAPNLIEGLTSAMTLPWLYLALTVYAFATVFWLYILQRMPLSLAYPFSALAMVIVPIVSIVIFKEQLQSNYWLGSACIILGVIIISK